ncbi:hypothetical protein APR04_001744 [Promicromonospora umidemergens]|uniref:Uncharacterized protein n=1 Tax=Promicromonospora umidemergens TaxID=629679 RepID=A0ABP8XIB4_9MICO|nr:hypothetical protein [Promicromonospora umidemergens]MCP2282841.1 hypothetical protein [Promicromonospora umidemergens]
MTSAAFPDDRSFPMNHPAIEADMWAMHDHRHTSATTAHSLVAEHLWTALRALGVTGGRMLLRGTDPEALAGMPGALRTARPGQGDQLQASIPHPGRPHPGLELTVFVPDYKPGQFDVVILNASYADVVHHDGDLRHSRWQEHNQAVLSSLSYTAPAGLVAALVSADVLDAADPGPRRAMAHLADLLGAARLPAGTLRSVAGCDSPVDLLLLRRRPDGQPQGGARFEASLQFLFDSVPVRQNEYFHDRPADMLGRPVIKPMPWGPARLTVRPDVVPLAQDLRTTLAQVVRNAIDWGLTARRTMTSTPGDEPDAATQPEPRRRQPGGASGGPPAGLSGGSRGRPPARPPSPREATGPDHPGPLL